MLLYVLINIYHVKVNIHKLFILIFINVIINILLYIYIFFLYIPLDIVLHKFYYTKTKYIVDISILFI